MMKRLNDDIKDIKERMKIIGIKIDGTATYNKTHNPGSGNEDRAILSLSIPTQTVLNLE